MKKIAQQGHISCARIGGANLPWDQFPQTWRKNLPRDRRLEIRQVDPPRTPRLLLLPLRPPARQRVDPPTPRDPTQLEETPTPRRAHLGPRASPRAGVSPSNPSATSGGTCVVRPTRAPRLAPGGNWRNHWRMMSRARRDLLCRRQLLHVLLVCHGAQRIHRLLPTRLLRMNPPRGQPLQLSRAPLRHSQPRRFALGFNKG